MPIEWFFTPGCTYSLNLAIQCFPFESTVAWTDRIIISSLEHNASSRPARLVSANKKVLLDIIPYRGVKNPFDLQAFELKLKEHQAKYNEWKQNNNSSSTPAPRCLVATLHGSNVAGVILPIERIGALISQYPNVYYLVDVAQTGGVLPVDVQKCHIDFVALAGHKGLYGPPGIGALYISPRVPSTMLPFVVGGTGGDSGKHALSTTLPDCYEVGTIALHSILAFGKGIEWVLEQQQGQPDHFYQHEKETFKYLIQQLRAINNDNNNSKEQEDVITIIQDKEMDEEALENNKLAVVTFNVRGAQSPKAFANALADNHAICLRAGYHCAPMAHEALGTIATGAIRASVGYHTTKEDVDYFVAAIKQEIAKLK
jgi:selenocysteine lyase/cysteine desulfurase